MIKSRVVVARAWGRREWYAVAYCSSSSGMEDGCRQLAGRSNYILGCLATYFVRPCRFYAFILAFIVLDRSRCIYLEFPVKDVCARSVHSSLFDYSQNALQVIPKSKSRVPLEFLDSNAN